MQSRLIRLSLPSWFQSFPILDCLLTAWLLFGRDSGCLPAVCFSSVWSPCPSFRPIRWRCGCTAGPCFLWRRRFFMPMGRAICPRRSKWAVCMAQPSWFMDWLPPIPSTLPVWRWSWYTFMCCLCLCEGTEAGSESGFCGWGYP